MSARLEWSLVCPVHCRSPAVTAVHKVHNCWVNNHITRDTSSPFSKRSWIGTKFPYRIQGKSLNVFTKAYKIKHSRSTELQTQWLCRNNKHILWHFVRSHQVIWSLKHHCDVVQVDVMTPGNGSDHGGSDAKLQPRLHQMITISLRLKLSAGYV